MDSILSSFGVSGNPGAVQPVQGYRLLLQGLAFPEPVPIFAAWRPNHEHEAKLAIEALGAGGLKVTDVLLP
jgi:hypothetical protein